MATHFQVEARGEVGGATTASLWSVVATIDLSGSAAKKWKHRTESERRGGRRVRRLFNQLIGLVLGSDLLSALLVRARSFLLSFQPKSTVPVRLIFYLPGGVTSRGWSKSRETQTRAARSLQIIDLMCPVSRGRRRGLFKSTFATMGTRRQLWTQKTCDSTCFS